MKREIDQWIASAAVHIGHSHHQKRQNCQDASAIKVWESTTGKPFVAGVIADGCGGIHDDLQKYGLSGHSEIGACLLVEQTLANLFHFTQSKYNVDGSIKPVLTWLFDVLRDFIMQSIPRGRFEIDGQIDDFILSIQQFWLATIIGFVVTDNEAYIFHSGDGCYQIDDEFKPIDQDNMPAYLAYSCLASKSVVPQEKCPKEFVIIPFDPNAKRVMIATDGFNCHDLSRVSQDDPQHLHGQQWNRPGQFGLKKWMNTRFDHGYFEDDCAIALLERKEQ